MASSNCCGFAGSVGRAWAPRSRRGRRRQRRRTYAVRRTLLPSAGIEKEIDAPLAGGCVDVHPLELVSELGRLGVRLVLQRAVEEEVDEWLGPLRAATGGGAGQAQRLPARRLRTGEGDVAVEVPQVREACAPFTSRLFRRRKRLLASEPLKALSDRRLRARPVDPRRRVALRAGRARPGVALDRRPALPRAEGALPGVPRARPLRDPPRLPAPRCDLPADPTLGDEGGRALCLEDQRGRRAGAARRLPGDARGGGGLALTRPLAHPPWPSGAAARGRRRRLPAS